MIKQCLIIGNDQIVYLVLVLGGCIILTSQQIFLLVVHAVVGDRFRRCSSTLHPCLPGRWDHHCQLCVGAGRETSCCGVNRLTILSHA